MSDNEPSSGADMLNVEQAALLAKLLNMIVSAASADATEPLKVEHALFSSITTITVLFRGKPIHVICRLHPGKTLAVTYASADSTNSRELMRLLNLEDASTDADVFGDGDHDAA